MPIPRLWPKKKKDQDTPGSVDKKVVKTKDSKVRDVKGKGKQVATVPVKGTTETLAPPTFKEVFIAVMGPTGAGKSTFINLASNSNLRIGDTLESCTDKIELSKPFQLDNAQVTLVDTPGFDDTTKSDSELLGIICNWLASEYSQGKLLHGIVYLHRISDNKMSGSAIRNFHFFQQLCGKDAQQNSVIVTNMWSLIDEQVGNARVEELSSKEAFFKPAIDNGAQIVRHTDTAESAHSILRKVLSLEPRPFQLQKELVDDGKKVFETAAGETLLRELAKLEQKHQAELQDLARELEEAIQEQDEESKREIEETRQQLLADKAKLEEEKERLLHAQVTAALAAAHKEPEAQAVVENGDAHATVPTEEADGRDTPTKKRRRDTVKRFLSGGLRKSSSAVKSA